MKISDNPKLTRPQIGDIKFHVTMYVVSRLTGKRNPNQKEIADLDLNVLSEEVIHEAIENTFIVYDAMGGTNGVAKGKEFVQEVLIQLEDKMTEVNKEA